jgi:hypothetical protein
MIEGFDLNKFLEEAEAKREMGIAVYGEELYAAMQHWINDPNYDPISRVNFYNKMVEIDRKAQQRDIKKRIIEILEGLTAYDPDNGPELTEYCYELIAVTKGDNK